MESVIGLGRISEHIMKINVLVFYQYAKICRRCGGVVALPHRKGLWPEEMQRWRDDEYKSSIYSLGYCGVDCWSLSMQEMLIS